MANLDFSRRQLLETAACTGCSACAEVCPAVTTSGEGRLSSLYRLGWQRRVYPGRAGWLAKLLGRRPPSEEQWREFAETVYRCTLCGNCAEVCPSGIGLREMWLTLRQELAASGVSPQKIALIQENLEESHNVFAEDQEERAEWVEDLDDPPDHGFIKERAAVVYFTGCVASYFPLAQQIPVALAEVFTAAGVDFTLMGMDEWCCGFPLLGAGLFDQAGELIAHNVAAVEARGAKTVVFACPSCYMMWKEHYPKKFELLHTTQFLERLIRKNQIPLDKTEMLVTYHDPCDLGRGARVFDPPRRVIQSLPGVRLQEMARSREHCMCCGGGGNLEMIDAELSHGIAAEKIAQVQATGAEAVVTACQQCVRTMATHVRRNQVPLKVMDIAQLVRKATDI